MISDIRKHFQSPLYKAAVWIAVVALAGIFSIPTLIKEQNPNPWVIKVNNFEVGAKEFNWALVEKHEWLSMVRTQYGDQADLLLQAFGIKTDPVSLAMESVIREALINDLAKRTKLSLHALSIQEKLSDPSFIHYYLSSLVPSFALQQNGSINPTVLRNFLAHKGMKPAEFEQQVEKTIERKVMMDLFASGAYIPFFDQAALSGLDTCQRSFEIVTLSYEAQLNKEKKQPLSEQEIEAYYALKKGSSAYQIPEKRAGIVWTFDPQEYDITVSDAEVEEYYTKHKAQLYTKSPKKIEVRHILVKNEHTNAQERMNLLYQQIQQDPSIFAEKAREFSDDRDSASKGGLLEPFTRGERDASFERAAFLLKNDGDISSVIKTEQGFELIQRVGIVQPTYQELGQVAKAIRTTLLQNKFSIQFATDAKDIKIKFKKDKGGLASFIEQKNGTEKVFLSAPAQESGESRILFAIKSLNDIDFGIEGNKGYLVQLTDVSKGYTADLSEVRDAVKEDMYLNRAQENLKKIAQEALDYQSKANRLGEVKKTYGGTLTTTPLLLASEIVNNEGVKELGLDASAFNTLEYAGLSRLVINGGGAHIIKVIERVDSAPLQEEKRDEVMRLQQQRKRGMTESFVASLYRNATIKTNESMINLQKNYSL